MTPFPPLSSLPTIHSVKVRLDCVHEPPGVLPPMFGTPRDERSAASYGLAPHSSRFRDKAFRPHRRKVARRRAALRFMAFRLLFVTVASSSHSTSRAADSVNQDANKGRFGNAATRSAQNVLLNTRSSEQKCRGSVEGCQKSMEQSQWSEYNAQQVGTGKYKSADDIVIRELSGTLCGGLL